MLPNFSDSVKAAFGEQLGRFHRELIADTRSLREYANRSFSKAAVWAPGRMIDQVDDMLNSWRKNNTSEASQSTPLLPIMIAATAKDFMPSGAEFGRGYGDAQYVMIPGDPKERIFKLRVVKGDFRTQVAIIASDEPTCRSIAMQLHLFMSAIAQRTFYAQFDLAGVKERWGVQIEAPDLMAVPTPAPDDVKNLTIMAVDLTLRATIPLLQAPRQGEPNDGKGSGPNQFDPFEDNYDPSGYPVVMHALGKSIEPGRTVDTPMTEWQTDAETAP